MTVHFTTVLTVDKERIVHVFPINQKQGKASLKSKNFERVLRHSERNAIFQRLLFVVVGKHSIFKAAEKNKVLSTAMLTKYATFCYNIFHIVICLKLLFIKWVVFLFLISFIYYLFYVHLCVCVCVCVYWSKHIPQMYTTVS